MATIIDTSVTAERGGGASLGASARQIPGGAGGIWTLDGQGVAVADDDGPATVLVPTEAVLLIAVDLPLPSRAKRIAALPFAIEDRIAEPVETVHLPLGIELSPRRYLVGVVRHDRMAAWVAQAEAAGLDGAAMVPDALALPVPGAGEWAIDLGTARALVRVGDGTGFAIPAAMLPAAWEAAGRPRAIAYGAVLPGEMAGDGDVLAPAPLGRRLLLPALDLRQGAYARRRRSLPSFGKRLARILAVGALAHAGIAAADTILLRRIADRREAETRALVTSIAPNAALPAEDIGPAVADLLPQGRGAGGDNPFLPAITRLSLALAPLGGDVASQAMRMEGATLTTDVASGDPAIVARLRGALASGGVAATVSPVAGGARIVMPAA